VTEQELLLDCVRRLNRNGAVYMLTGSMASNAWGIPRTTHDLDFVIQLPSTQVNRIVETFRDVAYHIDEEAVRAAFQPPHQFNVIHIPSALKVDFWMLKSEPFDREMFRRRVETVYAGERIWIARPEDIILHKLYWNRITPSERQLSDVAGVVAVQKDRLELSYLIKWATELKVVPELNDVLSGKISPKQT
jgi:hypothetical protein